MSTWQLFLANAREANMLRANAQPIRHKRVARTRAQHRSALIRSLIARTETQA